MQFHFTFPLLSLLFCSSFFSLFALISSFAILIITDEHLSISFSVVIHEDTLILIAVIPFHTVPPHQQVPSSWIFLMILFVRSASPKETSTWLSITSFKIRNPAFLKFVANSSA